MPYKKEMDEKLSRLTSDWKNTSKKHMFGGTGYIMNGNMVVGVYKDYYILRLGKESAKKEINNPNIKLMDINGRAMKAWVMVKDDAFADEQELRDLIDKAKAFVSKMPPK